MTRARQIATITEYLIEINELFYNAGNDIELEEKEQKTRENLHEGAKEILSYMKMKALGEVLKEGELKEGEIMVTSVDINKKDYEKLKKILEERGNTLKWWVNKKIKEEIEKYEHENNESNDV